MKHFFPLNLRVHFQIYKLQKCRIINIKKETLTYELVPEHDHRGPKKGTKMVCTCRHIIAIFFYSIAFNQKSLTNALIKAWISKSLKIDYKTK